MTTVLWWSEDVGGESFVLRIGGKGTHLLGIDRERESICTAIAAQVGVGAEVVHFLASEGVLVTRFIASTGYGYTVRQSIVYGYLPVEYATPGTRDEVQTFGIRYWATVMKEPLYDAKNAKIKM